MKITKLDNAILIGLLLGDGHLTADNKIQVAHSYKQEEYCIFKAKLLHSVVGGNDIKVHRHVVSYNKRIAGEKVKCFTESVWFKKGSKSFQYLQDLMYPNRVKTISKELLSFLNPTSIALWWMDDGNVDIHKSGNGWYCASLCLSTFTTKEQADLIINYFKDTWDVNWHTRVADKRSPGMYCLFCGKKEGQKFLNIIRDYVRKNVPSMAYKVIDLDQECRERNNALRYSLNTHDDKVCEVEDKEPLR